MWEFFTAGLREAVDKYVPKKSRRSLNDTEPMWFNQDSRKLVKKQRSLYNRFKKTGDPFDHKL